MWPAPFSCSGQFVSVVPLRPDQCDDLVEAVADGDLSQLWYTRIPKPEEVADEIQRRLELQKQGAMCPFAIIDKRSGKAVGMTTYMNIDAPNRRLEIGSTWYRHAVQRSPINTECKLLLLSHAFEVLNVIAVEFRTHVLGRVNTNALNRAR